MGRDASLNKIEVPKTARYFQLGTFSERTRHVWYVFHGYGQLAEYFIKHFEPILDEETIIIAPEGISRFYLDGVFGRVGASWMTKVDRLDEIVDQKAYLDLLHNRVKEETASSTISFTILGFSQGVATAWRWMKTSQINPDNFILWAGSVPEEFPEEWVEKFKRMGFYTVIGNKDQYISQEQAKKHRENLQKIHPTMEWLSFEGGHHMDTQILKDIHHKISGL